MTSKNSFLVSMKENNKRRLWVWVVSMLLFVLAFPVLTAFMINNIIRNTKWITEVVENEQAWQLIHQKLTNGMTDIFGFSIPFIMVISTIVAVISAVQGFSYLYSRKKIDFYMGMPVKRKKRFLIIWLDGILLYVIPYLLGILISMLIAAGNGAADWSVLYTAAAAFAVHLCFYLGVYHMAMLAVMLTGNIVVTCFGFLVFCLYEYAVKMMLYGYRMNFFEYFNYYGEDVTPVVSPFGLYMRLSNSFNSKNVIDVKYFLLLLLFALAAGFLSYICFLKRPAEAAGKAMTFEITKPVVKVLLVAPTALLAGLVITETVDFNPKKSMEGIGWVIFTMALAAVLGSALIQVIYEFDIKGALHKKLHILVSGGLIAFIFISFQYDLFGYDDYIPAEGKIESIAFVPQHYEEADNSGHFDSDGTYMSNQEYADKYMHLENIEEICELVRISMEAYNKVDKYNYTDYNRELGMWSYGTVIYHLKNGRTVSRALWVNVEDERTVQLLDSVFGSEEFKKGYMIGASEHMDIVFAEEGKYKIDSATYGNKVYSRKMSTADVKEFLDIYRRDLLALANFSNIRENIPAGVMRLEISEEIEGSVYMGASGLTRAIRTWNMGINIYPFYQESIAWLKDHDYYMDSQLALEDVASIQVINGNHEAAGKFGQTTDTASGQFTEESIYASDVDTRVYADYTQEAELSEIAACIYPQELMLDDWDRGKRLDGDYEVIVYFKTESDMTRNYGTSARYGFLEGEIPDFVREDTVYKE